MARKILFAGTRCLHSSPTVGYKRGGETPNSWNQTVEKVDTIVRKKKFCDFSMFYVLDNFQQFSKIMEMSPHPILRSKCFLVFRYFGQFAAFKNSHRAQPHLPKYELEMSVYLKISDYFQVFFKNLWDPPVYNYKNWDFFILEILYNF